MELSAHVIGPDNGPSVVDPVGRTGEGTGEVNADVGLAIKLKTVVYVIAVPVDPNHEPGAIDCQCRSTDGAGIVESGEPVNFCSAQHCKEYSWNPQMVGRRKRLS